VWWISSPAVGPELATAEPKREEVMTENTILISDSKVQSFLLKVWTPSTATNLKFWHCDRTRYQTGDWETVDKGFIRLTSGDAFLTNRKSPVLPGYCFSGASASFVDLFLREPGSADGHDYELYKWGIALHNYTDGYGRVQDSGKGEIKQSWSLALEPGPILWKKATDEDLERLRLKRAQQGSSIQPSP
jgi:hypothetical protein